MNLKELRAFRLFLKNNEILLVNADNIGDIKLPEINWGFIEDCLIEGDIKGIIYENNNIKKKQ